jgi:hypothetical protein
MVCGLGVIGSKKHLKNPLFGILHSLILLETQHESI